MSYHHPLCTSVISGQRPSGLFPAVKAFYVTVNDDAAMVDLVSSLTNAIFVCQADNSIVPLHFATFVTEVASLCFDPAAFMATGLKPSDRAGSAAE